MNNACGVIASGCVPIRVVAGGEGILSVTVTPTSASACDATDRCEVGRCLAPGEDAGADAASDAFDDATSDASIDGGGDTGPVDAGPRDSAFDSSCGPCPDPGECEELVCEAGACVARPLTGTACGGGQCYDGACCQGCWDGSSCLAGDVAAACGTGGGSCAVCSCPEPSCNAGACGAQPPFRDVNLGSAHACYILDTGALYCAGRNNYAQLGQGSTSTRSNVPLRVGTFSDWEQVMVGSQHACGIRSGGALYCWGRNHLGQTGNGRAGMSVLPERVGTEVYDRLDITLAEHRTIARRTDGAWVAFGYNPNDLMNVGAAGNVESPRPIGAPPRGSWDEISLGDNHLCGLTNEGRFYCFGSNDGGQLARTPSPGVMGPVSMSAATNWVAVHADSNYSCGLNEDGALFCVGDNPFNVLGMRNATTTLTQVVLDPVTAWTPGRLSQCVRTAGGVTCWGRNDEGQLGFENTMFFSLPTRAAHLDDASGLHLGRQASYAFVDGANRVWGSTASTLRAPFWARDDSDLVTSTTSLSGPHSASTKCRIGTRIKDTSRVGLTTGRKPRLFWIRKGRE